MNTDYNLYKIFLYLYEERSISKTANKLYVSQPAVSYSLKELENQLGYKLFYRNSKGIEPTLEANELYSYISTAFNILNDAEEHIKNLNNLSVGCIKIGIPSNLGTFYLSKYITEFNKLYPDIKFEIISKSTNEMIDLLETRELDLVIDNLPINSKKNVSKVTLSILQNCFAYNKELLGDLKIDNISDLVKYSLILPSEKSSIRQKLNEYMESHNMSLNPILESLSNVTLLDMVKNGIGIGYFIKDVIDNQNSNDKYQIITFDDLPKVHVCCVYLNDYLTTAASKFIELLTNSK